MPTVYQMDTLESRDRVLEMMWSDLEDVPMNPETECIEEDYYCFPAGTNREEIWHWFDERHTKGVAALLYGTCQKQPPKITQLLQKDEMCEECMSETCAFNPDWICRFPLVYGRAPRLSDDGCRDWVLADIEAREDEIKEALGANTADAGNHSIKTTSPNPPV